MQESTFCCQLLQQIAQPFAADLLQHAAGNWRRLHCHLNVVLFTLSLTATYSGIFKKANNSDGDDNDDDDEISDAIVACCSTIIAYAASAHGATSFSCEMSANAGCITKGKR